MDERSNGSTVPGASRERSAKRAAAVSFAASAEPGLPPVQGLYDPALDKDSCGVGFIADIKARKSHKLVTDALTILLNLEHRGAVGADPRAGDGAGILVQIPHKFFAKKAAELGFKLPKPGQYAVGALFMPRDDAWREVIRGIYADMIKREGLKLLGWREVPTDNSTLGESVKPTEPVHLQVFIGQGREKLDEDAFERVFLVFPAEARALLGRPTRPCGQRR
jgi:glutamate synthase (NADPH/NADH) large chain